MQLPDGGGGECSADYMGGDPLEGVAKMCLCVPRTLRRLPAAHCGLPLWRMAAAIYRRSRDK